MTFWKIEYLRFLNRNHFNQLVIYVLIIGLLFDGIDVIL